MYFDLYLRKNCTLFGKQLDSLLNSMKDDNDLENKHKECLEYYKGEDLISYKLKIEPLIFHILNSTKNKENKAQKQISKEHIHIHNYKDLDDNVEKVPTFIYF